ncbi:MAG: hypothetical protein HWN65_17585 [Candidatus Helarchaeota archaeon]|nr:hypothetical protein [Candidatus Helarchaeota archaeon]
MSTIPRASWIILHSTSKVQLSIGRDAHIIFLIGAMKPIWEFMVANDFLKRLILIYLDFPAI